MKQIFITGTSSAPRTEISQGNDTANSGNDSANRIIINLYDQNETDNAENDSILETEVEICRTEAGVDNETDDVGSDATYSFQEIDRGNPPASSTSPRPFVKLIYPNVTHDTEPLVEDENLQEAEVTIVIDPRETTTVPEIIGAVIEDNHDNMCVLSILGVKKYRILSIIVAVTITAATTALLATQTLLSRFNSPKSLDLGSNGSSTRSATPSSIPPLLLASTYPSSKPSESPDPRIVNITSVLFEISGDRMPQDNSPQTKALNWILYKDERNVSFDDPCLIQRYALMVIFYALSGESWISSNGYGSGNHECDWYGTLCRIDSAGGFTEVIYELILSTNNLEGLIPHEIGLLGRLRVLDLSGNHIQGTIPDKMYHLTNLKILKLCSCSFSGTISSEIIRLQRLSELFLADNQLSGSVPSAIGQLPRLQELILGKNKLTGNIPSVYGNSISVFGIARNRITGSIPSEFGRLPFLSILDFGQNDLSGTIPLNILNHPNIVRLDLQDNNLSGTLPLNMNQRPTFEELLLSNNDLSGVIPNWLGSMWQLRNLDLSHNRIGGMIPSEIGDALNLRYLTLSHMQLTGSVPSELGNLSFLLQLMLSGNDFSGKLPDNLCDLSLVSLETNCFTSSNMEQFSPCSTSCLM